jgi:hypothetical protein
MVGKILYFKIMKNFVFLFGGHGGYGDSNTRMVMLNFKKISFGSFVGLFHCRIFICWVHMFNDSHASL